jgi:hypothetical protein
MSFDSKGIPELNDNAKDLFNLILLICPNTFSKIYKIKYNLLKYKFFSQQFHKIGFCNVFI